MKKNTIKIAGFAFVFLFVSALVIALKILKGVDDAYSRDAPYKMDVVINGVNFGKSFYTYGFLVKRENPSGEAIYNNESRLSTLPYCVSKTSEIEVCSYDLYRTSFLSLHGNEVKFCKKGINDCNKENKYNFLGTVKVRYVNYFPEEIDFLVRNLPFSKKSLNYVFDGMGYEPTFYDSNKIEWRNIHAINLVRFNRTEGKELAIHIDVN